MPSWQTVRVTAAVAAVLTVVGVAVLAGGVFGADTLARQLVGPQDTVLSLPSPLLVPRAPAPAAPSSASDSASPAPSPVPATTPRPAARPSRSARPTPPPPPPVVAPKFRPSTDVPLSGEPPPPSVRPLQIVPLPSRNGGMLRIEARADNTRVVVRDGKERVLLDRVLDRGNRHWVRYSEVTVLSPTPHHVHLSTGGGD